MGTIKESFDVGLIAINYSERLNMLYSFDSKQQDLEIDPLVKLTPLCNLIDTYCTRTAFIFKRAMKGILQGQCLDLCVGRGVKAFRLGGCLSTVVPGHALTQPKT